MSDTPEKTELNKDPSEVKSQESSTAVNAQQQSAEDIYTKSQVDDMLNKIRKEEKDKLYASMEKRKQESEDLAKQKEQVLEELNSTKKKLEEIEDSKLSDMERLQKQIQQVIDQNSALQEKIKTVETQAERRIRESELNSYRSKRIQEEGILMPELVIGSDKEELDKAIQLAKQRESSIRESLEDQLRKEMAVNVPKPISPSGEKTTVASADRYSMSKKSPQDYQAVRQQLMAKALESMRR